MKRRRQETRIAEPRWGAWSRFGAVCVASLGSSLLMLLAAPPFNLWPLVFAAPAPLIWAAARTGERRLGAAVAAAVGAIPVWAWEQQWIFGVSPPGAALLAGYLALYSGIFLWLTSWGSRRLRVSPWLLGPVVWVGVEMLRGRVVGYGYPWMLLAHPLIEAPWLARAAAVVGTYGVSLLAASAGAAAWVAIAGRGTARRWGAGALVAIGVAWAGLSALGRTEPAGELRLAVVQTNVPQSVKGGWAAPDRVRDLDRMLELTVRACSEEPAPELVAWPETMFPGAALDAASVAEERRARLVWFSDGSVEWPTTPHLVWRGPDGADEPVPMPSPLERGGRLAMPTSVAADSLLAWQERLGVPLLIGAEGIDGLRLTVRDNGSIEEAHDGRFNSSYLVDDGRATTDRYDKIHLTPFGEVMPYISAWPALEGLLLQIGIGAAGMQFNLDAGDRAVTHEVATDRGPVRVATPICFEGIMPGVCRRLAYDAGERRADLLVQLTNEGWFGTFDAAREQHLQIVRWRAVELGVSVVRAANTGISAAIDPHGAVIARGVEGGGDIDVEGVLRATVPLAGAPTPYGRIGDLAGWVCFSAACLVIPLGVLRRRRESRGGIRTDKGGGGEGGSA